MTQTKNSPFKTIRDGRLKATIWSNRSQKGTFYNTTFSKLYEDKEGNLKDTNNFGLNDLPRIAELAQQAFSAIQDYKNGFNNSPTDNPQMNDGSVDEFHEGDDLDNHYPEPQF